jgi:hypothetical protein
LYECSPMARLASPSNSRFNACSSDDTFAFVPPLTEIRPLSSSRTDNSPGSAL